MSAEPDSLLAALRSVAEQEPDRVAIAAAADGSLTHRELVALLDDALARLAGLGVTAGVRVAVHTEGGFDGLLVQLVCMAGATAGRGRS